MRLHFVALCIGLILSAFAWRYSDSIATHASATRIEYNAGVDALLKLWTDLAKALAVRS